MAASVHGITHTDLNTAFGCGERFYSLLAAMVGKIIVALCAEIERRFLLVGTMMLIGEPLHYPVIDTMVLEEKKHPPKRPSLFRRWFRKNDTPSLRLNTARLRYGLPFYRPHHNRRIAPGAATGPR